MDENYFNVGDLIYYNSIDENGMNISIITGIAAID